MSQIKQFCRFAIRIRGMDPEFIWLQTVMFMAQYCAELPQTLHLAEPRRYGKNLNASVRAKTMLFCSLHCKSSVCSIFLYV